MATIRGTTGNDTLVGTSSYDAIFGDAGDDTIDGGAGNDRMAGGDGNDTFIGGDGADWMDGGAGVDSVTYAASSQGVSVYLGSGTGYGGLAAGDTLISIENVTGSQHKDVLAGSDDSNAINGGGGDDYISGGGGNDVLSGSTGNDNLTGGSGADTFNFGISYGQSGVDVITDFQVGTDKLHFDKFGWQVASMNDLAFSQAGSDTVIAFGSGESVTLRGVDLGQLMSYASTDFLFS
jgi:Ca2+-binding RTX toxin-like protein